MAFLAVLLLAFTAQANLAPFYPCTRESANDGLFIVMFHPELSPPHAEMNDWAQKTLGARAVHTYAGMPDFRGLSAFLSEDQIEKARALPEVKWVEENCIFRLPERQIVQVGAPCTGCTPTWGQMAIDAASQPWSNTSTYNPPSTPTYGSTSVVAYVVDTGILCTHEQFQSPTRCTLGPCFITGLLGRKNCTDSTDDNGHGTHCAGTIGGNQVGVNKRVGLVAIKVLNAQGSGSTTDIVDAINWVSANKATNTQGTIMSMSLGGGTSATLNQACDSATANGVNVVVAAGNDGKDAKDTSPCNAEKTICVGATDSGNNLASYSNFGALVDILAPGTNVYSAWYNATNGYATISGTSMATPHTAGVATIYASYKNTPSQTALKSALKTNAFKNAINIPPTKPVTNEFLCDRTTS
jgi:serine protease